MDQSRYQTSFSQDTASLAAGGTDTLQLTRRAAHLLDPVEDALHGSRWVVGAEVGVLLQ